MMRATASLPERNAQAIEKNGIKNLAWAVLKV